MKGLLLFCTALFVDIVAVAQWMNVGRRSFSNGDADYTSLALYNGVPYAAFSEGVEGDRASVMKFDGTWLYLGSPGISAGIATYISLAIEQGVLMLT